nr:DUF6602 domain-containing protein [uncultured Albidiferax sp.]
MPDKNQYQALLRSKIKAAITQAKAASVFSHNGVKGKVLEILIGELFKPLLPADIGVGTGQIIDCYSSPMSPEIDIILYDKSILPPVLLDDRIGIFPIESVLYTIEVKTTLNASELSSAHKSAEKLSKLGYLPGLKDEFGKQKNHSIEKARSVLFALGTDLSGTGLTEAQRYKNIYGEQPAHLRAICVAGKEYWYDNGEYWLSTKPTEEFDEVLAFIGGVTNTYKEVSKSRHSPLLGNYLVPEATSFTPIESRKVARVTFKCDGCGKETFVKPNVGKMDLVVNGTLSYSDVCPDCGGKMNSAPGTYKFVKGELIVTKVDN